MEFSFNELEQRLLRYLKQQFLDKGNRPPTMHDPAVMDAAVMEQFGFTPKVYRELLARLEHHGIVRGIATGAPNGHLHIQPKIVEIVRELDEHAARPAPPPDRMEQAKRFFFRKWWFVVISIGLLTLTAVATFA
jgi:hypothetical protein